MEVYTVERTGRSITLGFRDENPTLVEPLIKALNDDKTVIQVRYINYHPELADPVLVVEVSKGKPEDAVKKAAKTVSTYFSAVKQ